jgi:hypothetical protein
MGHEWETWIIIIAQFISWTAITLTLIRGFPVIAESYRLFKYPPPIKKKKKP